MFAVMPSPRCGGGRRIASPLLAAVLATTLTVAGWAAPRSAPSPTINDIVSENQLPGSPASQWDVSGAGDPSIQGFAVDISYAPGDTAELKIDTDATDYRIDIYRMGWYGGDGARLVTTVQPSATLPQVQPAPLTDPATGLTDCGNWDVSATWIIPLDAVSGIYFAKLVREDPDDGRASHILFVVRDDDGHSDVLVQTSDTTWQAYNTYGGNSLYSGSATTPPVSRAHKVSYNRPFVTRGGPLEDWVFNAEYPMVRWLESNGYDVSYTTGVDTDRRGAELLEHPVFLSVGHDEYWSAGARASVEAARAAGIHLAFFSGNEVYWKIRWEPSSDAAATPYRTLVCYKEGTLGETTCGGKCDPLSDVWTGLWRDGCTFSPPADGCRPENAISGQISWVGSSGSIEVPSTYAPLRFWRNTSIAGLLPNQTATLSANTLGYEWDFEQYPASYPPGRVRLSRTVSGGQTHHLSLYRHASGSLVFGAGTVQWSWGLDGTHDRGGSTPDVRMQQATVNLLAEMGAQPATLQPGLTAATPTGDVAAPTSTIGFPLPGGSVSQNVALTINGTASDAGGIVAGVEVSVDGGATWSPATGTTSWTFAWTPTTLGSVTIRARSADDWGSLESAGPSVTVTVEPAPPVNCPCSIWNLTSSVGTDPNDASAVELGVKFRSDSDGSIAAVRYYKHTANTGTHVAHLWTGGGTLLATATFTGESSSGWQEVEFASPVAIDANATYVASVFMPNGHYAFTGGYFTSSGTDNPPLHALQSGVDGPNGVYRYGAGGVFPTDSFNNSNYWVDVVLAGESAPDSTPPLVVGIAPGNGTAGVPISANISVIFNEAMDPASIGSTSFELQNGFGSVAASVTYVPASHTAVLDPVGDLANSETYSVVVRGGALDPRVKDVAGNALAADLTWSFTTAAPPPPPPDEGPGGPILVVATATNPFGRYYAEILRTEGLNEFTVTDISTVTPAVLEDYDVVVVAEMSLSGAQSTMLSNWVQDGGNLIAMRPDAQLASLLGLVDTPGTLANAYLRVDTSQPPGSGIVGATIQFHGAADLYTLNGATAVAALYSDASTATANPAVTWRGIGNGQAAAFTYDLARSVVYTRQGNPEWSGQERDGVAPIRSDDLFYGAAAGDPQPDWVDLSKVAIPQADEQQRLLANLILHMNAARKPLPRFWYLPRDLKAAVVMTGDNHGSGGTAPRFDIYMAQSPAGCSVDDWECVRASSYLYVTPPFTDAQALYYHNLGFEVGIHVDSGCGNWTLASLQALYDTQLASFTTAYPSIPAPSTNRTHCIVWSNWADQPKVEVAHGIRLDTNYYYWPGAWVQDRPGMFTGSGMPMRFADLDGTMVDCYQVATQMTDESSQSYPFTIDTLLDRALGPEGYYGAFCANMHTDSAPHSGSDAIVASALSRGVPVISGRQMLQWLDGRNGSSFGSIAYAGNVLDFTVAVGAGANNLRAMLPTTGPTGQLSGITHNSLPIAYTTQTIKGIEYAFFTAEPGAYAATYEPDTTSPAITDIVATPDAGGTTAMITWNTDEPATSRVDYGTLPGSLTSNVTAPAFVSAHSLPLAGLTPGTTYYFRVTAADPGTNSSTSPASPAPPASFVTPLPPAPPCFVDMTTADFAAGSFDPGVAAAEAGDGEIILAPTASAEFSGTALPAGWASFPWGGGGSSTVAGGLVTIDGARLNSVPAPGFGPGRSLEFVATFAAAPFQHVGFGGGNDNAPNEIFNTAPWAILSTGASGSALQARCWNGGSFLDFTIPGSWLGTAHRYRIDWSPGQVDFYIDGALVHSEAVAIAGPMRPAASDFTTGGAVVTVDWMRMSDYSPSGIFESRVFDSGGPASWEAATWSSDEPVSTSVAIAVRTGNTPLPDGGWTAYTPIAVSGTSVGMNGRYIQYRATLATTDPARTPALRDVSIACNVCNDVVAPAAITGLAVAAATTGLDADGTLGLQVTWPALEPGATIAVYRKGYGDYPEYDDGSGVVPMPPLSPAAALSAGWTLTAVASSGDIDEVPVRDEYSYVGFATDGCDNVSAVSNLVRAVNYRLGDVSDGVVAGQGNNTVSTEDLSLLGARYGACSGNPLYLAALDYGPTDDGSVLGRPMTDNCVDFEELVLLAINYQFAPAKSRLRVPEPAAHDALVAYVPENSQAWRPGDTIEVQLWMQASGRLQGLSIPLEWNTAVLEPLAPRGGELLDAQGGTHAVFAPRPGSVDIALLGRRDTGLSGAGLIAVVPFRVLAAGDAGIHVGALRARDTGNRAIDLTARTETGTPAQVELPRVSRLHQNVPNPFNPTTTIHFDLAQAGQVQLQVYDVNGRVVRTLLEASRPAGRWSAVWDGRDESGRRVSSGVYVVRMQTAEGSQTKRITLVK